MNKIIYYLICGLLPLSFTLNSCSDDDIAQHSIFDKEQIEEQDKTVFDEWLLYNYTYPYNIDFKYRMEDIESDMNYTLAPADLDKARKLAKLVKHLWIEAYNEVAGADFTRTYIPRVIHVVGSPAYESFGMVVGTAEGGKKVTLYNVNSLEINQEFLNKNYFQTMHHEFAHILHQTKHYGTDFERISEGYYTSGSWYQTEPSAALRTGFIDAYASSQPREDFAETLSIYITSTSSYWDSLLSRAGETGAPIIREKMDYIRNYMTETWGIDVDRLREVIQRRSSELGALDLDNFTE